MKDVKYLTVEYIVDYSMSMLPSVIKIHRDRLLTKRMGGEMEVSSKYN